MCKAFRFMSLDWRDLFDEIDDLSLGAQLAVVKLIGKGWHRGAPLPDDNAKIARMLAVQVRTWLKIRVEIEGLFDLSEGAWNHHQFKRARQHAECRAKAGSRSQTPENSPKVCDFPDHKPWETNNRSPHKNKDKAIDSLGSIARPDVRAHAVPQIAPPNSARRQRKGRASSNPEDQPRAWPRRTPFPDDWTPTAADVTHAMQRGHDHVVIAREAQSFANYYAARGTRFADIGAAWRRWVERIGHFEPRRRGEPPSIAAAILAGSMSVKSRQTSYG